MGDSGLEERGSCLCFGGREGFGDFSASQRFLRVSDLVFSQIACYKFIALWDASRYIVVMEFAVLFRRFEVVVGAGCLVNGFDAGSEVRT